MNQEANQLESQELKTFLDDTFDTMDKVLDDQNPELRQYEIGTVNFVGRDIARVGGLPHIRAEELVRSVPSAFWMCRWETAFWDGW